MLSSLSRKFFFKGFEWGNYLCHIPYRWCQDTGTLKLNVSKGRYVGWYLNILLGIGLEVWLTVRTIQMSGRQDESRLYMGYYIITLLLSMAFVIPLMLQLNIILVRYEIPQLYHLYMEYFKDVKDQYWLPENKKSSLKGRMLQDKFGLLLGAIYAGAVVVLSLILILIPIFPKLPPLFTSLLSRSDTPTYVWVLVLILQELALGWYISCWFGLMFIYAFPGLEIIFAILEMSRELDVRKSRYRPRKTRKSLRTNSVMMKTFRELKVVQVNAVSVFSPLILPMTEWSFLILIVYCIIGCITLEEPSFAVLMGLSGLILTIFLSVCFTMLAQIPYSYEKVLQHWRYSSRDPLLRSFAKSVRPFRVYVGPYYWVDKGMVLNMLRFVMEGVADLLVLK